MTAFLAPIFYKLVYMSLTGLAAGAVVLLLRRLADKRFSPVWKYAMWLLVLAALVVPWRPQSPAAVLSPAEVVQDISFREDYNRAQAEYDAVLAQTAETPQASPEITVLPEVEAAKQEAASLRAKTMTFDTLLPLLWLCGVAGTAAFMGIGTIRLRRHVRRSGLTCDIQRYETLLDKCKQQLGIKRRVSIVLQSHVGTPALMGLLRPVILLPTYAEEMSDAHLEYVILHELSHLRRGDHLVNALLLALQAVYWFNPLVWLLFKYVREDMELANDAAVLKGLGLEAQKEYSLSLVEVLMGCSAQRQRHTMLCMTDGKKNIERRVGMIQLGGFFKKRKWVIALAGVLVISLIATLFLTAGRSYDTVRIDDALEQRMEEIAQEQYAYYKTKESDFLITAVKIYGAYRQGNTTRVFVTVWAESYSVAGSEAFQGSASIVPASVTYRENDDGTYRVSVYKEAEDGENFPRSIESFSILPSGKKIPGLARKILNDYKDHSELDLLHKAKLTAYLAEYDLQYKEEVPELFPVVYSFEAGRGALKPLIWGSAGWQLDTKGGYMFAHFYRYVVRYDIAANMIDKIIDLGDAPESWYYAATFSPDGRYCVAQAREFDFPAQTNTVRIDMENETCEWTQADHYDHSATDNPHLAQQQLTDDGYRWFMSGREITALRPYAGMIAEAIAIDENRVGALLPAGEDGEGNGVLGYYRFAVIDLAQDKIVQECAMNVLGRGEAYPKEPEETVPLPEALSGGSKLMPEQETEPQQINLSLFAEDLTPPPDPLSAAQQERIRTDYYQAQVNAQPAHLPPSDLTLDGVQIDRYFGTYNGSAAVMIQSASESYAQAEWKQETAGYVFEYNNGRQIIVWNDGRFYTLPQAYEQGLLTSQDVGKVWFYYSNG